MLGPQLSGSVQGSPRFQHACMHACTRLASRGQRHQADASLSQPFAKPGTPLALAQVPPDAPS